MSLEPVPALEAFIDANLLVLLVVGSVDRQLVGKHRRVRAFTQEDYGRLLQMTGALNRLFVTPNILTEASNLLESKKDCRFLDRLRIFIDESEETILASSKAARHSRFPELGLTDAVLLEIVSEQRPLITVDFDLFLAAVSAKGAKAALNFTHSRFP